MQIWYKMCIFSAIHCSQNVNKVILMQGGRWCSTSIRFTIAFHIRGMPAKTCFDSTDEMKRFYFLFPRNLPSFFAPFHQLHDKIAEKEKERKNDINPQKEIACERNWMLEPLFFRGKEAKRMWSYFLSLPAKDPYLNKRKKCCAEKNDSTTLLPSQNNQPLTSYAVVSLHPISAL